jgi:hypothetical protein
MEEEKEILTPEEIEQIIRKLEVDYRMWVNSGQIGPSEKRKSGPGGDGQSVRCRRS